MIQEQLQALRHALCQLPPPKGKGFLVVIG